MKIRICHHDTVGLANDAELLKQTLEKFNMDVSIVSYPEIAYIREVEIVKSLTDVNIFLEHIHSKIINFAKINVFVPNPEWMNNRDTFLAQNMDHILCKTRHCFTQMNQYFQNKTIYIGFTSIDRSSKLSGHTKFDKCLHLKGVSKYKNSQLLLDTWMKHPEWPTLYIVSYGIPNTNGFLNIPTPVKVKENIVLYQTYLSDDALKNLMNLCGVHVCCSYSEGFGHYINEARSTRSVVVTTDGSPMNEFVSNKECLIKYREKKSIMHSYGYTLESVDIESTMTKVFAMTDLAKSKIADENRMEFEKQKKDFETNVEKFVKLICK